MGSAKYYYNSKTLKYERARMSFVNAVLTSIGLVCFGAVFFLGLFILQNKLIVTEREQKLLDENSALKNHYMVLTSRLTQSKNSLDELQKQNTELHGKFFEIGPEERIVPSSSRADKRILIGDWNNFDAVAEKLDSKFKVARDRAIITNEHYSRYASVLRSDLEVINSFPGAWPIEDAIPEMLVSGFGKKINPWHKRNYQHDGVDIAGARGSNVVAAGSGRILQVKRSDLQAGFGNYVEIDHGHGYVTRYTHLGNVVVKAGQKIKKGETIATMGISGGSIAPHVHYEVIKEGKNIDPVKVMVEGMNAYQFHVAALAASKPNQSLD